MCVDFPLPGRDRLGRRRNYVEVAREKTKFKMQSANFKFTRSPGTWVIMLWLLSILCYSNFRTTACAETIALTGKIIKKPFINKIGRKSSTILDLFLKTGNKELFVKACEGKIPGEELAKEEGKMLDFEVVMKKGEWDKCGAEEVQSRVGDYVVILSYSERSTEEVLKYGDGSGNLYIIGKDSIEYVPVKKENSSSGVFDGGEPGKKKISEQDFRLVAKEFDEIFRNKKIQIKDRIMTSGILTRIKGDKKYQVIISRSPEQAKLEKILGYLLVPALTPRNLKENKDERE